MIALIVCFVAGVGLGVLLCRDGFVGATLTLAAYMGMTFSALWQRWRGKDGSQ